MKIKKAQKKDKLFLEKLTYLSKSYWDYDSEFLDSLKEDDILEENEFENNLIYKLCNEDEEIIGYYQFDLQLNELEGLFLHPNYIGQGLGKYLWEHLLLNLKANEVEAFEIISDPNAEGFYLKMGAERIRMVKSLRKKNRELPLLKMTVN